LLVLQEAGDGAVFKRSVVIRETDFLTFENRASYI